MTVHAAAAAAATVYTAGYSSPAARQSFTSKSAFLQNADDPLREVRKHQICSDSFSPLSNADKLLLSSC